MTTNNELSELQLSMMRVLWRLGEATVARVRAELEAERPLAITTIATILTRLERRGVVTHGTRGRQYVYRSLVSEDEVRRSMVDDFTERVFQGDLPALVSHLLSEKDISPGDLAKVKALIEAREDETEPEDDH